MSDGAGHSRLYRSTFLGYATPREIVLYQRLQNGALERMLTQTHEETHFHLFQITTFGFVQGILDRLVDDVEAQPDISQALLERRLDEDAYEDFLSAYQQSLFRALRAQESTAAFCELCIAEAHGAQEMLLAVLPERSKQYGVPIHLDCDVFRSGLGGRYRTKSLRGQVVYNIARVALNRRPERIVDDEASLAAATRILLGSGPSPDEVYDWFVSAFEKRWPEIEALLDRAETSAVSASSAGVSIDLLCFEALQAGSIATFHQLEEAFKVAVLDELEQYVLEAFDTTPNHQRARYRDDVFETLAPVLGRHGWLLERPTVLDRSVSPPVKMVTRNFETSDMLAVRVADQEVAEFARNPTSALWSICLYPFVMDTDARFGEVSLQFRTGDLLFSLTTLEVGIDELDNAWVTRINWPGTVADFIPVVELVGPKWPMIIMVNGNQNDLRLTLKQQAAILNAMRASNRTGQPAVVVDRGALNPRALFQDAIFEKGDRVAYTGLEEGDGFGLVHLRRTDDLHIVWSAAASDWTELKLLAGDRGYPVLDDLADVEKVRKLQLHLMVQGALLS